MELKEMIKVMQHFEDGGYVEFSEEYFKTVRGEANKEDDGGSLCWDWDTYDYRIKEPKQKVTRVTIEKWLCRSEYGEFVIKESTDVDKFTMYEKVKLIESYEVEL